MKPEVAGLVLLGTSGGGVMAWLLALWGYCCMRQPGHGEHYEPGAGGQDRLISIRTRWTEASKEDLLVGLCRVFELAGRAEKSPPLAIVRDEDSAISVANAAPPNFFSMPAFSHCRVEVGVAESCGVEISFRADHAGLHRKALRLAGALLAAGLAVLLGVSLLLWLVAPHLSKAAGLVQLLQCALFLFLAAPWGVYALYRRARRGTETFLDSAIANASTLAEAFATKRRKAAEAAKPER